MGCCQGAHQPQEPSGAAEPEDVQAMVAESGGEREAEPKDVQVELAERGGDEDVLPLLALRGTPFFEVLRKGHMAVVRSTYFEECLAAGVPFQDRAHIPPEAFINGEEVAELWEEYGWAFLVIISYPWLARGHPDPDCYHLPRLAFRAYHDDEWEGEKGDRVRELGGGVILDFCAFWQGKDRTAEQTRMFKEGLKLINVPYGHSDVTALKLTSTPATQVRRYDDRGWTHFESTVIDGKAPSARSLLGARNVLTCDDGFGPEGDADDDVLKDISKAKRKPPLTPLRFREELEVRRKRAEAKGEPLFTNGQDSPIILERYDASFEELRRSTKLDYTEMQWGAEETKELALALPYFGALKELWLSGNHLDGEAAEALAAALPNCPMLSQLFLENNQLGSDAQAFAMFAAAALGTCRALETLDLDRNGLGAEAAKALAAALPRCPTLRTLCLHGNNLGEDEKAALRAAWRDAGKDEDGLRFHHF